MTQITAEITAFDDKALLKLVDLKEQRWTAFNPPVTNGSNRDIAEINDSKLNVSIGHVAVTYDSLVSGNPLA